MASNRKRNIWLIILVVVVIVMISFIIYFRIVTRINPPTETDPLSLGFRLDVSGDDLLRCDDSWLHKNKYGLWEMYIEGSPLELGTVNGLLAAGLVKAQEDAFVKQIRVMVPSESYLKFLKYFLAWFNKDLDTYIQPEYLFEIYGVSAFASDDYNFIGTRYNRILNYHAAHDIGHALQNMNLVECTAFGLWDERTADSSLLIGRNFDFYVGNDFAANKIIAFVKPEEGYRFASITWAGMIGVVSGMNEKGLSISLNSAKSDIPFGARTPVSIIAREILQYASNIEEALAIASARPSFVSESFLIGSAADRKAVVIEKSPEKTALYDPDTNFIILTNHFQSERMKDDPLNVENMENKTSVYRHERVQELLSRQERMNYLSASGILRNRQGLGDKEIGMGNELAINQLIAHHSVIFEPEKLLLWVSTAPWQLGDYLCYDLDKVFRNGGERPENTILYLPQLQIPADSFLLRQEYLNFMTFKRLEQEFRSATENENNLPDEAMLVRQFTGANPEYYQLYVVLGRYFMKQSKSDLAMKYFNLALTKEIPSETERKKIIEMQEECHNEK